MDQQDARVLALSLMRQHGLPVKGWSFNFDEAKKRFGVCKYKSKSIGLSRPLTLLNTEAEVRDTILHEIAHALAGHAAGHGPEWKKVAASIGAKPVRCFSTDKVNTVKGRYRYRCYGCGHTTNRHKRPSSPIACRKCCDWHAGGRFDKRFVMQRILREDDEPMAAKRPDDVEGVMKELGGVIPRKVTFPKKRAGATQQHGEQDDPPEEEWVDDVDLPPPTTKSNDIIRQLETEFAPRIAADDPIRTIVRAFELAIQYGLEQNVALATGGMKEALASLRKEMEEAGAVKLRAVSEELGNLAQRAIKGIRDSRREADSCIIAGIGHMESLVQRVESATRVNVWRERIIGLIIAGMLAGVGFLLGRVR